MSTIIIFCQEKEKMEREWLAELKRKKEEEMALEELRKKEDEKRLLVWNF